MQSSKPESKPKVNRKWTESTRGSKIARIFRKIQITLYAESLWFVAETKETRLSVCFGKNQTQSLVEIELDATKTGSILPKSIKICDNLVW